VDGNASQLSQEGARCALTFTCSGDSDLHDYAAPCHAGPAPSAAGGLLLADDEAQGSLLEPAERADASEPGAPLALDSAGALTDAPPPEAREPSISGDDALDDVRGAGQGASQPASATGALIADEVSWIGAHLRADSPAYVPPACPPNQDSSDVPDDEATSEPRADEPMLPVTRAVAVKLRGAGAASGTTAKADSIGTRRSARLEVRTRRECASRSRPTVTHWQAH